MLYDFTAQSYNVRSVCQNFAKIFSKLQNFDITMTFHRKPAQMYKQMLLYRMSSQSQWIKLFLPPFFFLFIHFHHECSDVTEELSVCPPAGGLGAVWWQLQSVVPPSLRRRYGRDGRERGLRLCWVFADGRTYEQMKEVGFPVSSVCLSEPPPLWMHHWSCSPLHPALL